MENHGVQIYIEGHWVTIPAASREQAIELRDRSLRAATIPCRRVVVLTCGTTIFPDVTE